MKTLTGGLDMKNMVKNGTGSDQRLERNSNPTEFTRRGLTTFVFSTDLTPVDYVLAVGDTENFPFTVIVRILFKMPKINSAFWDDVNCPETKKDN